jgi:glycosyltransferase involved in cell wall biosynthesis
MKKNNIKILHVILSKGFAGSEKYVVDLIKYQKKTNKVNVIISNDNKMLNNFLRKNIKVFKVGKFFKKYQIKSLIKKIEPNIVHTHLGEASKTVSKSPNYKVISTMHMNFKASDYQNSDAIIVLNNSQLSEIKKKFGGKIFKSYLWVNLPRTNITKSKLKKNLNIPKKNFIFGSIGRFHPQTGFDIIIKVFQKLKLVNCTIILIGNGHKEYKKFEKINGNFRIIGHVENVSNYYNIFDAGIFMSRWETFGFSLIEGMKFKLPIISSKHIGNKDWIDRFEILKVSQNNEIEFKKNIKKLYKSQNHRKKYDLRMFDYKKNCNSITSIYQKMLVK